MELKHKHIDPTAEFINVTKPVACAAAPTDA
jgi:hypothetical protein